MIMVVLSEIFWLLFSTWDTPEEWRSSARAARGTASDPSALWWGSAMGMHDALSQWSQMAKANIESWLREKIDKSFRSRAKEKRKTDPSFVLLRKRRNLQRPKIYGASFKNDFLIWAFGLSWAFLLLGIGARLNGIERDAPTRQIWATWLLLPKPAIFFSSQQWAAFGLYPFLAFFNWVLTASATFKELLLNLAQVVFWVLVFCRSLNQSTHSFHMERYWKMGFCIRNPFPYWWCLRMRRPKHRLGQCFCNCEFILDERSRKSKKKQMKHMSKEKHQTNLKKY